MSPRSSLDAMAGSTSAAQFTSWAQATPTAATQTPSSRQTPKGHTPFSDATVDKLTAAMERMVNPASPPTQFSSVKRASSVASSVMLAPESEDSSGVVPNDSDRSILDVLVNSSRDTDSDDLASKLGSVQSEPFRPIVMPPGRPVMRTRSLNSQSLRTGTRSQSERVVTSSNSKSFEPALPDDAMGNFASRQRIPMVRNSGTLAPHGSFTSRRKHQDPSLQNRRSPRGSPPMSATGPGTRPPLSSSSNMSYRFTSPQYRATMFSSRGLESVRDADIEELQGLGGSRPSVSSRASTSYAADADVEDEGLRDWSTSSYPMSSVPLPVYTETMSSDESSGSSAESSPSRPWRSAQRPKGRYSSRQMGHEEMVRFISSSSDKDEPFSQRNSPTLKNAASKGDQLAEYHLNTRQPVEPPSAKAKPRRQPQIATNGLEQYVPPRTKERRSRRSQPSQQGSGSKGSSESTGKVSTFATRRRPR